MAESLPKSAWIDTDDLNGNKNGIHATNDGFKLDIRWNKDDSHREGLERTSQVN